jgi:hypothetical protein
MQSISCADVADVCVKALHNPTARNKSFDVSNPTPSGSGCSVEEQSSCLHNEFSVHSYGRKSALLVYTHC